MNYGALIALAAAWGTALAAAGQGANPAFANPATPDIETARPAADTANASDHLFLRQAAIGNRAEIDAAELATQRAQSPAVRQFAQRMQADHGRALDEVEDLARAKDTPLPRELDLDHQVVLSQLRDVEGAAFDVDYIRAQIVDHQRTLQLLQYQVGSGQSDEVRALASSMIKPVMEHLAIAKGIHAELTGAAP